MSEQRIDGYLSRKIIVQSLNGDSRTYNLYIIKPVYATYNNRLSETIFREPVILSSFDLIPYSEEIPFIIYIDKEIKIKEISLGLFEMT